MSFSDSRQTFMPSMQSYVPGSDAISICPQFSIENEDQTLDFDSNPPPFKRARNSDSEERHTPSVNRMIPANAPMNKGMNNIFWKTRLCAKFKMGLCRNGENCNFAHGVEDMRQPPPNWQEMVGLREEDHRPATNNNWDDDQRIIHRMKICKKFYNGEECPYGDRCNFLHEDPARYRDDAGRLRESSVISFGPTVAAAASATVVVQGSVGVSVSGDENKVASSNVNGSDPSRGIAKPTYWRTKLCNKWEQTGHCPFGDKCHFAHGFPELQASSGRESEVPGIGFATNYQLSANDSFAYAATNAGAFSEEARANKRCLLRWKGLKKINRIYGDWLDDLPLAHNIPSRVES